jgi:hypothetical protein
MSPIQVPAGGRSRKLSLPLLITPFLKHSACLRQQDLYLENAFSISI